MKVSTILFSLQGLILLVLLLGDIGFDHPGRFGLAFDHLLLLLGFQVLLFVVILVLALKSRDWNNLFWGSLLFLCTLPAIYVGELLF